MDELLKAFSPQIGFAASIASLIMFTAWLVSFLNFRKRDRQLKQTQAALDDAEDRYDMVIKELIRKQDEFDARERELDQFVPSRWLVASREMERVGDYSGARNKLEIGFENIRADFGLVLKKLFQRKFVDALDSAESLRSAIDIGELAHSLWPDDELHDQLQEARIISRDGFDPELAALIRKTAKMEAIEALRILHKAVVAFQSVGQIPLAFQVNSYAVLKAQELEAKNHEAMNARFTQASLLSFVGEDQKSYKKLRSLLRLQTTCLNPSNPQMMESRHLEAQLLTKFDKHADALEIVETMLPVRRQVLGDEHHNVHSTEYLNAQILWALGKYTEALKLVQSLIPRREKLLGRHNMNVLTTYTLEWQILERLGRHHEALEKARTNFVFEEELFGHNHPFTEATRQAISRLSRLADANDKAAARADNSSN